MVIILPQKKKKSTEKDYIEKNYFKFKTRQGAL